MHWTWTFLLVLGASQLVNGQRPDSAIAAQQEALARQLLDSPRAADQAWGAYFTGRLNLGPLYQKLLALLAAPAVGQNERESETVIQSLLDALIQSRLPVQPDLLRPYEVRWPAETLILLARTPDNEDKLLELRGTARSDGSWYAINNLLLKKKSARMFLRTLASISTLPR